MFYDLVDSGILLRVRLTPNSSSCRVTGVFENADGQSFLKINVVSVPEKGQANKELICFLSKKLGLAKSQCEIVGGTTDRYKKIKICGVSSALSNKIDQWLKEES